MARLDFLYFVDLFLVLMYLSKISSWVRQDSLTAHCSFSPQTVA